MKSNLLKVASLLVCGALIFSCKKETGPQPYTGKPRTLTVFSQAYEPYVSNVNSGMEGVDLKGLSSSQKNLALKLLNEIPCACGCRKTTVAECRVRVTDCDTGKQQADFIVNQVKNGAEEDKVVRSLYELILNQRLRGGAGSLLMAISSSYSKDEIVTNLSRVLGIDVNALQKTGNEIADARNVARVFLGEKARIVDYLEGIPDELYILHGIVYELLPETQRAAFEYYFFQYKPELQEKIFPYFNKGKSESEMIIGMAEDLFQEPPSRTGINVEIGDSPSRGPSDAPITLVEFGDFQCPYSQRVQSTLEQFYSQYSGKVRHVYKNMPLSFHPLAEPAARAALAAGKQGKFWEYRKLIFDNQRNLSQEIFVTFAQQLGLDVEKFKADMDSREIRDAVQDDLRQAIKLGVQSTPTLIVNGTEIRGARSLCSFIEAVE